MLQVWGKHGNIFETTIFVSLKFPKDPRKTCFFSMKFVFAPDSLWCWKPCFYSANHRNKIHLSKTSKHHCSWNHHEIPILAPTQIYHSTEPWTNIKHIKPLIYFLCPTLNTIIGKKTSCPTIFIQSLHCPSYIHLYGIVSNAPTTFNSTRNWINHKNSLGDFTDSCP